MGALGQRPHEVQHLGHGAAFGDALDDGRSHDTAIRDRGDGIGRVGGRDAEAHDHRQTRGGADAGDLGRDGGGIGLDLIARLCEHLGWRLAFSSTPGRGTRTTLSLHADPTADAH